MKRLICLLFVMMMVSTAFGREYKKSRHFKKPHMDEEIEIYETEGGDEYADEYVDEEINIGPREEKIVFRFLKETEPDKIVELKKLRAREPFEYKEALQHILFEMKEMEELKGSDPKLFDQFMLRRKLERHSHKLAEKIRHTRSKEKRAHLEEELKAVLTKLFPLRCLEIEREINNLSRELKKAQMLLEKKKKFKDKVIERRFRELTGAEDALAW